MSGDGAPLRLRLMTPGGSDAELPCDSVRLTLADDSRGRGGGSMGIRKGHTHAVMALGDGPLRASLQGKPVFSARVHGGFATVRNDVITVIAETAEIEESPT